MPACARNIPPDCSGGFAPPLDPVVVLVRVTLTGRDAAGRTGLATRRIRVRARRSP